MGLFSSTVAEVTIDFYGQKKRKQVVSNVQVYYTVSMTIIDTTPSKLASFYADFLFKSVDIAVLPDNREIFWEYLNESFKNIISNPSNIFHIWPGFIDLTPISSPQSGKANTSVNVQLLDKGKTTYKISEGSVAIYYVPLATVAFMQYIVNTLSQEEFNIFYENLKQHINNYKINLKKVTPYTFNLLELAPLKPATRVKEQTNTPNEKANTKEQSIPQSTGNRFCSSCGAKLMVVNNLPPKFCGSCGAKQE